MFLPVFILLELASHGKHGTINAFVMWTGPSTKHLVEVAATQIQHWSLVPNILLYLLSMAKSSATEKIPIKKLTCIIREVWSNSCIPFSSVKKGHSLPSVFTNTGCHVQYLTLAVLVPLKCFVMCTPAPTHTAHIPGQTHCNSCVPVLWMPFRLLSCSKGTKQMEALCKRGLSLVSVLLGSNKIELAFHQGRQALAGGQNLDFLQGWDICACQ